MKRIIKLFLIIMLSFTIVNAKEIDFSINSVDVVDKSTSVDVGTLSFVSNKIDTDTLLKEKNDYITYNVNIKNNDSDNYKLIKIEDNNTNKNINICYDSDTNIINSKDNINITVNVTYSKLVKNIDRKELNDFDIILVLQDTNGEIHEKIINPDTGDNTILYVVLFVTSIIGLGLILKEKKKTGMAVFGLLFMFIPLMIFGVDEYKVPIRFSNISVIGYYEEYNIIIDYGNGTTGSSIIKYGDKIGSLPSPSKDGYDFVKFVDQNGNTVTEDTIVTKELTITAVYNIINYNITYNLDGGTASNVNTFTIEDEVVLNNPTKAGYSFTGWSEGSSTDLNTTMVISRGSTGDKVFTAHYSANTNTPYIVIHKQMNMSGQYVEYEREELTGTTDQNTLIHTKTYPGFTSPEEVTVPISGNGDTVVTYEYSRNKYNLVVNNRDYVETDFSDGQYYYETMITMTAKDRVGYTFSKWSDNNTNKINIFSMDKDITIEPIYTPNDVSYKVIHKTMKLDGSSYEFYAEDDLYAPSDSYVTPNTKTIPGFTSPTKQTVQINPEGTTEIYYYYERNKYTLTITNPEDVVPSDVSGEYYYDYVVTLTAKAKTGYTFNKWSNNETDNIINVTIHDDTTLEALYTPNQYTIVFNANTGTGSMNNMSVKYDETKNLTTNSFVKEHFEFMGWNTKADGTGTSYEDVASIKNLSSEDGDVINLYAIWGLEHREYGEHVFDGTDYYNTGMKLFGSDYYEKNFEISVDITNFDPALFNTSGYGGTVFNSMLEEAPYPGLVFRINNKKWELKATLDADHKYIKTFDKDQVDTIKVIRIGKKIYYSVDREDPKLLADFTDFEDTFEIPLVFGASVQLDGNTYEPNKRNLHDVTLDNMSVKILPDDTSLSDYENMIDFEEVYRHDGDYTFDGSCDDVIKPLHENGDPVYLYTSDTYLKDFEISFKLGSYVYSEQPNQATIVNSKYEDESVGWPGFALRFLTNNDRLQISSNLTTSDKKTVNLPTGATDIILSRTMGKFYYKVGSNDKVLVHNLKSFTNFFSSPLVIGGNVDTSGNNYARCFKGTLSDIVVKVEK